MTVLNVILKTVTFLFMAVQYMTGHSVTEQSVTVHYTSVLPVTRLQHLATAGNNWSRKKGVRVGL